MIDINEFRRRSVAPINWVFALLLVGALVGGVKASILCVENSYFQDSMQNLAWRYLKIGTLEGALGGLLVALAGLVLFVLAWIVLRVTRGHSRTNVVGAATAAAVMMLFALTAFQLNVKVFPSLLSAPSLFGNAMLVAAAIVIWWGSQKLLSLHQVAIAKLATSSRAMYLLTGLSAVVIGAPIAAATFWRIEVSDERPNVLVIVVDTLRADRLGSYGYERQTSPNIDKVARDGWLFTNAIAQASFTKPSIASLITGLYARQTSVTSGAWAQQGTGDAVFVRTLSPEHVTLAELFASLGYETAAFGKNHHLLPQLGFSQGYFEYDWEEPPRFGPLNSIVGKFRPEFAAAWINRHFIDWLDDIAERKFFAYLHHIDVHWPYKSPPPFAGMFTDFPVPEDFNRSKFMPETVEKLKSGALRGLAPATVKAMSDAYDEGIRHVDDGLGMVFAELIRQGLYDNTLIVITADHGEEFMEHGLLGHGETLYDEVIRVPLIIKFPCPGPYCGQRTAASQVELVDIFPTLLQIAGAMLPDGLAGQLLTRTSRTRSIAFSEMYDAIAMRSLEWKWIYHEEDDSGALYNLRRDRAEKYDLSADEQTISKNMQLRTLDFSVIRRRFEATDAETVEADQRMLDSLRALGYVK